MIESFPPSSVLCHPLHRFPCKSLLVLESSLCSACLEGSMSVPGWLWILCFSLILEGVSCFAYSSILLFLLGFLLRVLLVVRKYIIPPSFTFFFPCCLVLLLDLLLLRHLLIIIFCFFWKHYLLKADNILRKDGEIDFILRLHHISTFSVVFPSSSSSSPSVVLDHYRLHV